MNIDSSGRMSRGAPHRLRKSSAVALLAAALALSPALACYAQLNGSASRSKQTSNSSRWTEEKSATQKYFLRHPTVKKAAVGAGVGLGVGAVTGLISRRGVVRGSAIGASTGAGLGLLQASSTLARHPIMKDAAQGTLLGAGLGLAANKGRGEAKKTTQSAAAGAAVGLGIGLLKHL